MDIEKANKLFNELMHALIDEAVEGTEIAIKEHNIPLTEESVELVAKGSALAILSDLVSSIMKHGDIFMILVMEKAKTKLLKGEQQ